MHIKEDATIYKKSNALQLLPGIACQTRMELHLYLSLSISFSLPLTISPGNDGFGCVIVMIRMNSIRNCLAQHDEYVRLNKLLPRLAVWFIYFYIPRREARSKD